MRCRSLLRTFFSNLRKKPLSMWVLFCRECYAFLDSLVAYVVIGVFLLSMWLLLWFFPESSFLAYGYADMGAFFGLCPYVLLFLVPAITMRSYAEERRLRTLELLLCAPIAVGELVLAKFLAALCLLGLCLLLSGVYYVSLYVLGSPVGNIDAAQVVGSYVGLWLLGAAFCAVGQSISSFFCNQLVAFVASAFLCFFFYFGLSAAAALSPWGWQGRYASWLSLSHHYDALGKGLIDLQELLFFLSFIGFFLLLTAHILRAQR